MAPPSRSKRNTTTTAEKKSKALKQRRGDQLSISKRRNGLFNKVTELSILCQSETALIVTSKNHDGGGTEIFACGYPSPDAVIQRFLTGRKTPLLLPAMRRVEEKAEVLRSGYEAEQERLKEQQRKLQAVMEEREKMGSVFPSWWETPIDGMDVDFVEQFKGSIQKLRLNLIAHCEMMMVAPPPSPPVVQKQNAAKFGVWVSCASSQISF